MHLTQWPTAVPFRSPPSCGFFRFCPGSFQISIIAKIAGPGRKRHSSDPDPSSGSDSGDGQPVSAKCLKMSSDGGSDAVGRRGASQPRRGHGREPGPDLTSWSSKKKQKDRANQESREAKRAVAVLDGVIAEVKRGQLTHSCRSPNVQLIRPKGKKLLDLV